MRSLSPTWPKECSTDSAAHTVEACSVREVKGYGRQKSYLDQYGDSEYSLAFLPKVEITLWAEDERVDEIVRKVVDIARTGRMGDGKIIVLPVSHIASFQEVETKETHE